MPKRPERPQHSVTVNGYMYRWDSDDEDEDDAIFEAWESRDWLAWLTEHLRFPFQAQRMEDEEGWGLGAGLDFRRSTKILTRTSRVSWSRRNAGESEALFRCRTSRWSRRITRTSARSRNGWYTTPTGRAWLRKGGLWPCNSESDKSIF